MPTLPKLTKHDIATRHEVLYQRLATLTRQTEAAAARRPDAPVSPSTSRLAEDLLFEARQFSRRRKSIPPAAPDLAGLATQLGQAMAALDSFEAAYTVWDETLKCFVWWVRGPAPLPVARLKPKAGRKQTPAQTAHMAELREKLVRRMEGDKRMRYNNAFADGFRAAQAQAAEAAEAAEPSPRPEPRITPAPGAASAREAPQPYDAVRLSELNPRLHFRD